VYTALLKPGDMMMGLALAHGGHLTHGHKTETKKVSATSHYFESCHYHCKEDGFIDYEEMEKVAIENKPKIIIAGISAYPQ
jgi:glycine hydroxymethyltransferase